MAYLAGAQESPSKSNRCCFEWAVAAQVLLLAPGRGWGLSDRGVSAPRQHHVGSVPPPLPTAELPTGINDQRPFGRYLGHLLALRAARLVGGGGRSARPFRPRGPNEAAKGATL